MSSFALALVGGALVHCGHASFDADCTMDGRGLGYCDVTNTGKVAGNHCFRVRVSNKQGSHPPASSDVFCSGRVEPRASERVAFFVRGARDVCRAATGDDAQPAIEPSAAGATDASAAEHAPPWHRTCDFAVEEAPAPVRHDATP